jgi:glycosyltransferase involved in cell wall biosynthesis
MLAYWAEGLIVAGLCRRSGAELLRVHFGTNGAVVARLARRMGGPPYCVAYHGPDDFDGPIKWDIAGVIAESAFVTAITRYCSAQLMRFARPEHWPKIHLVPCGVDDRFLELTPLPTARPRRLCTIARIAPAKGLPLLIEALAQARACGAELMLDVVGEGPLRPALESRARELGLAEAVRFHGALSGEDVRRVIQASSGIVLPSFAEGLPVVLMEAMGLGRPALTTRITGIPELVIDGHNGWLMTPADPEALVRVLIEFAQTSDERLNELGRHAHQAAAAKHQIKGAVLALDRLLEAPRASGGTSPGVFS